MTQQITLFGVRSAITVEYEETCFRAGIAIESAVSLYGAPRLLDMAKAIRIADFDSHGKSPFICCGFFPETREKHFDHAVSLGLTPADALIDPTAILPRRLRVGNATFINAGVIIGAVSIIGRGVLINRAASLGHHTMIDDFVSIGPGATLASNVGVGRGTVIGAGATILPDMKIGENCVVAGGAVVRENVPDNTFVAGVPAKPRPFDPKKSKLYSEDGE